MLILTDADTALLQEAAAAVSKVISDQKGKEQDKGYYLLCRARQYLASVMDNGRAAAARAAAPGVGRVVKPEDLRTSVKPGQD